MPLIPKGLTKGLIERIKERISLEFGQAEQPEALHTLQEPHEHLQPLQQEQRQPQQQLPPELQGPATTAPAIMFRIRYGARTGTLLWLKYNNTWRHIEPYSFRYRSKGMQPLFFAYCELHDEIHSFRVDRIQDIHVTDRPYTPRNGWSVEIA